MTKQQFRLFDKNGKEQPIDADRIQDELDQMQSIGYQLREVGTLRAEELRERVRTRLPTGNWGEYEQGQLELWEDVEAIIDELTVQPRAEEK